MQIEAMRHLYTQVKPTKPKDTFLLLAVDVLSGETTRLKPDTSVFVAPTLNAGIFYTGLPSHLKYLCKLEFSSLAERTSPFVLVECRSGYRLFRVGPQNAQNRARTVVQPSGGT